MWLVLAILSVFCFGLRGIFYQWTSQKQVDRNLLLLGVFITGMIVTFVLMIITQQPFTSASNIGVIMGFFSFTANAAMYRGFAVGKASVVAIIISLPPLVVVTLAYFLWGETLNLWQGIAFVVILTGIIFIRYSSELSLQNLKGVQWALLAMIGFGFTDLSAKQAMLWDAHIFPTLFLVFTTGTTCFFFVWLKNRKNNRNLSATQWSPQRTFFWGMTIGLTNVSGMTLILPAFDLGVTGLVSAVVAMNVLLILFYLRIFLKNKFNTREIIGISMALGGIVILHLLG